MRCVGTTELHGNVIAAHDLFATQRMCGAGPCVREKRYPGRPAASPFVSTAEFSSAGFLERRRAKRLLGPPRQGCPGGGEETEMRDRPARRTVGLGTWREDRDGRWVWGPDWVRIRWFLASKQLVWGNHWTGSTGHLKRSSITNDPRCSRRSDDLSPQPNDNCGYIKIHQNAHSRSDAQVGRNTVTRPQTHGNDGLPASNDGEDAAGRFSRDSGSTQGSAVVRPR